jgi:RNA polymerase sigma-70 factor (ECF subfamily)
VEVGRRWAGPHDVESIGLLAMCLFTQARRHARTTAAGEVVLLPDQDRTRWDRPMIDEGTGLLKRAMRLGRSGRLQVPAAIAGVHSSASSPEATEWGQIAALYEDLVAVSPTAGVRLNHAVAVSMAKSPEAGLLLLNAVDLVDTPNGYAHSHAARASLLAQSGEADVAVDAYDRALQLTQAGPER